MAWLDFLLGRPLASSEEKSERLGTLSGVPIFGLDALGSAAYGPEAALTLLLPLGIGGIHYIVPITIAIVALLGVVYFSYRQTIAAYPQGGSSYVVARQNLGNFAGLLAGTALMVDFVLVVAVGIAAGIGALVSAIPSLQTHTLLLCLFVLVLITFVNLRGIRTTGIVFMFPTYFFIVCLLTVLGIGLFRMLVSGGHPIATVSPPNPSAATMQTAGVWLILRSFANGCTAMTGVEAVSTGITAFRDPRVKIARRTLSFIIGVLALLLVGIAWVCRGYEVSAMRPERQGYQTVLSLITVAVIGRNWFYYITIASILMVLVLQANTAFTGFPNVCRAIAQDGYLPYSFLSRGRRLVYSHGIYVLTLLAAALLIAFQGVTDRLIPLFAVGAFLAFTLSQSGMVAHWKRLGGAHARHSMVINGVGAMATAITVLIVIASKFVEGAWITLVAIPGILLLMQAVRHHYDRVRRELASPHALPTSKLKPPIVVVPVEGWSKVTQKALRFALTLSPDILALQVSTSDEPQDLEKQWSTLVEAPLREAGLPVPKLKVLRSPYRAVIHPTVEYIHVDVEKVTELVLARAITTTL
jgi:amino acid transporter